MLALFKVNENIGIVSVFKYIMGINVIVEWTRFLNLLLFLYLSCQLVLHFISCCMMNHLAHLAHMKSTPSCRGSGLHRWHTHISLCVRSVTAGSF